MNSVKDNVFDMENLDQCLPKFLLKDLMIEREPNGNCLYEVNENNEDLFELNAHLDSHNFELEKMMKWKNEEPQKLQNPAKNKWHSSDNIKGNRKINPNMNIQTDPRHTAFGGMQMHNVQNHNFANGNYMFMPYQMNNMMQPYPGHFSPNPSFRVNGDFHIQQNMYTISPLNQRKNSNFNNNLVNSSMNSQNSEESAGSFQPNFINGLEQDCLIKPKRIISCQNLSGKDIKSPKKDKKQLTTKSSFFNMKNSKKNLKDEDKFHNFEDLVNNCDMEVHLYCRSQKGSRTLQKMINKMSTDKIDMVLENLKDHFPEVIVDLYGNYFCQRLIQCSSSNQRVFILNCISNKFADIACNASGTHSLQTLVEMANLNEEKIILKQCAEKDVIKLSLDNNATHVIQKIISLLRDNERELIISTILKNFNRLAYDSNGICVLKKIVSNCDADSIKLEIIRKILSNALEIIQNPFGNYIVQSVIEEWGHSLCKDIINIIINNIISLSMQKFSSNVVEKILEHVDKVNYFCNF